MRAMKLLAAVAVSLSVSASPVLARTATPASGGAAVKLSVSNAGSVRASTAAGDSNELSPAILIGVLATIAIIGGALILADGDDDADSN